jgi:septum formation protein
VLGFATFVVSGEVLRDRRLVLASRSPQRRAILEQLGILFEVRPAAIEERKTGPPEEVVIDNALRKARQVAREVGGERRVLGSDTGVALNGHLYGKAQDIGEARAQLERLSGRAHRVWSALALLEGEREQVGTACTTVIFKRLDSRILDWYLRNGEWRGRAGSYAIQERGAALVERIEGDYFNVVGLPVALLLDLAPDLVGY